MMRSKPACGFALLATALMLPACGSSNHTDTSAVVARVNGVAITADQVKQAMPAIPANATAATRDAASKAVVEALVRQEVLAQKAKEAKLDREPEVMRAVESARRAVLAEQWLKKSVGDTPMPSEAETRDYIAKHPEMFAERRQFTFRVAAVQAKSADIAKAQQQFGTKPTFDASLQYLRDHQIPFKLSEQLRTSDQLPSDVLKKFSALKEGDTLAFASGDHLEIAQLLGVKPASVEVRGGDPRVANLIKVQGDTQRAQAALKSLAASAKVEIIGEGADAPRAAVDPTPKSSESSRHTESDVERGIAVGLK